MNKSKNLHTTFKSKILSSTVVVLLFLAAIPIWEVRVHAIVWCHDYTLYRVSCEKGKCENNNNTPPGELRRRLKDDFGYDKFLVTNAAEDPENVAKHLRSGDVIILRDDHSGFVNAGGTIDHFVQVFGESGTVRDVGNLPENIPGKVGGLYRSDTFMQFLGRPFYKGADRRIEIWRGRPAVDLVVEVRDADTNRGIYEAEVHVRSKSSGTQAYSALTNEDGATDTLELPSEKTAQGLQLRVKANNYEEKWSDIASELLTGGDRRFTVYLKRNVDMRFVGTWRCQFNYSITLNSDGTGVFTDSRGGPQGSLYASGTFNGKWTSSGNSASLTLGPEHRHRSGTFVLTLKDGKLSDQFGGVFTK